MNNTVPILITLDIHCYPKIEKEVPLWLEETLKLLNRFSIKASFLFPAIFAEQFAGHVRMILNEGHEIGCHGLTHGSEEQYHFMAYEKQKVILHEAKSRIEDVTGTEVISFAALTALVISSGRAPPLVSQSTRQSAPASAATARQRNE